MRCLQVVVPVVVLLHFSALFAHIFVPKSQSSEDIKKTEKGAKCCFDLGSAFSSTFFLSKSTCFVRKIPTPALKIFSKLNETLVILINEGQNECIRNEDFGILGNPKIFSLCQ